MTRPKAYSYIRMSTADQAKGDSTRRQDKATREYAQENNLELAQILIDEGVSAFTGSNAEFGKLGAFIAHAQEGKIEKGSFLIVESLDRISRQNIWEAMALLQKIIELDINIVTLYDKRVYSANGGLENQNDLIFAIFTLMRAHEESQLKSIRLKASWENKRSMARDGMRTRHVIPKWLRYTSSGAEIEAIPERASIIREIFRLCHSGWGAYSIAKKFNDQGLETWGRAKFWQESYIKKIVHNRSVLGEYQPHILDRKSAKSTRLKSGEPIIDYYPRVIESHIFYEVQSMLGQRSINGRGRKGGALSNIFSGLIFCHQCGGGMRFINKGKPPKGGTYLRCTKSILTGQCTSKSYRYPEIEKLIIQSLRQLDTKKIRLDEGYLSISSELMSRSCDLRNDIKSINDQMDSLIELYDKVQLDEVSVKLSNLSAMKIDKESDLKVVMDLIDEIKIPEFDLNKEISDALDVNYQSDDEKKSYRMKISSIIKELVVKITIFEDTINPWDADEFQAKEGAYTNLRIRYRNGASQVWYGVDGSNLYMESSEKMNLLRQSLSIARRD